MGNAHGANGVHRKHRLGENAAAAAFADTRPGGIFMCLLANLRQVDCRRRVSPFAEASDPGGSRNGSTEMRS